MDMDKQNLNEIKKRYDEDGFVILKNYLSHDQLTTLKEKASEVASRLMKDVDFKDKYHHVLKSLNRYDSWFKDQLDEGPHIPVIGHLMGCDPIGASVAWFDRPIGDHVGIEPHTDLFGPDKREKLGATIWLSIDRATRANGCLSYLRGSHKKIYQDKIPIPGVDKNSSEAVFAELEPGDAVIHDARIVHWSEGNLSEFPRRAVSYFYFSKKI
jgi:phytanoyl-CoA hydroxylase